jgi:hypothetical protein
MDRVAVFVDAGYFFAQGSALLNGQKTSRGDVSLDIDKLLAALEAFACRVSGLPLLRTYWYDGTSTGPTPQHVALAFKPRVKVRLGFVNTTGQQKGVDSLIVTDMINLARNRAMAGAVLLSGDEDVRVGVQQAQEFGVQVHLLGISPCRGSQSTFLLQEADTTHEWGTADISSFLSLNQRPVSTPSISPLSQAPQILSPPVMTSSATLSDLASGAANEVEASLLDGLIKNFESTGQIPPDLDRPLVGRARRTFGQLDQIQLKSLRASFVDALRSRLNKS